LASAVQRKDWAGCVFNTAKRTPCSQIIILACSSRRWLEGTTTHSDNHAMRVRGLLLLLVVAIVVQSCWAIGEWLHTHGPHHAALTTASLQADSHYDGLHDDDRAQPADAERNHHHSCFAHSPFTVPTYLVTAAVTTEAFTRPVTGHRSPDAPAEDIDRPNWRSPA